jgi:hypothetical protein
MSVCICKHILSQHIRRESEVPAYLNPTKKSRAISHVCTVDHCHCVEFLMDSSNEANDLKSEDHLGIASDNANDVSSAIVLISERSLSEWKRRVR